MAGWLADCWIWSGSCLRQPTIYSVRVRGLNTWSLGWWAASCHGVVLALIMSHWLDSAGPASPAAG